MILAIDTTGLVASCAIVDEHKTVAEFSTNFKKTHSQTIMPMIDNMLNFTGIGLEDMDYIACAVGPGSFTGIRIGVAIAKGLALGAGKEIIPVTALDALAYNTVKSGCVIAPIMDARQSQVYACFYEHEGERQVRLCDYFACHIDECIERARAYGKDVLFLGDGTTPNLDRLKKEGFSIAHPGCNMQRAASVGALALVLADEGAARRPSEIVPYYIRLPQAERELKESEGGKNNPDAD